MAHSPKPLKGHRFHAQTNDALRYIIKDAADAAWNMRTLGNAIAEGKYLDQVNDAVTILGWRNANNITIAL